jgi:hypothetical protein
MSTIPTIFSPDELNELIDLRNHIARAGPGFYIAAHQANRAGAPQLADLCYQIAELLTKAKVRADQAILAAASPPPVSPQPVRAPACCAPSAPKGPIR